jgi:hypothetical protein
MEAIHLSTLNSHQIETKAKRSFKVILPQSQTETKAKRSFKVILLQSQSSKIRLNKSNRINPKAKSLTVKAHRLI